MAFWINIYGCQPHPRHGPLSVKQLKNYSYRYGTVCTKQKQASCQYKKLKEISHCSQNKTRVSRNCISENHVMWEMNVAVFVSQISSTHSNFFFC